MHVDTLKYLIYIWSTCSLLARVEAPELDAGISANAVAVAVATRNDIGIFFDSFNVWDCTIADAEYVVCRSHLR
jgi:hypothetical protein